MSPVKPATRKDNSAVKATLMFFAVFAVVMFLLGAAILYLMIAGADSLVALGLVGNVYYVLLVPLGLSASAFLFGVLRSHAYYRGKNLNGHLELGGPIVGFVLVIILGFVLVPDQTPFALTVFVHGEKGRQDMVLCSAGEVYMDIGPDRRSAQIGDKGQAYFSGIPANFRGKEVSLWVSADRFETVNANLKYRLNTDGVYITVRRKAEEVNGRVQNELGAPVAGAVVSVPEMEGTPVRTDATGYFRISILPDRLRPEYSAQISAPGYETWHGTLYSNTKAAEIILRRNS